MYCWKAHSCLVYFRGVGGNCCKYSQSWLPTHPVSINHNCIIYMQFINPDMLCSWQPTSSNSFLITVTKDTKSVAIQYSDTPCNKGTTKPTPIFQHDLHCATSTGLLAGCTIAEFQSVELKPSFTESESSVQTPLINYHSGLVLADHQSPRFLWPVLSPESHVLPCTAGSPLWQIHRSSPA